MANDDGSIDKLPHEARLRMRVEEAMSAALSRELEVELKTWTPEEIDHNLLQAQFLYAALLKGEHATSPHPAARAWEDHLKEYGPLVFTDDPLDDPKGYTYEMALGFGEFCKRWESSRTFLGLALNRVIKEAARLGLLDHPGAVEGLRRKVVEEVTAIGAKNIVEEISDHKSEEPESSTFVRSEVVAFDKNSDLGYSPGDVRDEVYGKPIGKLHEGDLVPILDTNELPEICRIIHIMRLLRRTRAAIYNALCRMTNLELERGGREIPLEEWDLPKPIEAGGRHKMWSKSAVILWKTERELREQSPRKRGGRS